MRFFSQFGLLYGVDRLNLTSMQLTRIVEIIMFRREYNGCKVGKKEGNQGELTFEIGADKISEGIDKAFQRTKRT